jgi:hypothetical protein
VPAMRLGQFVVMSSVLGCYSLQYIIFGKNRDYCT